jgi:hypothetical protein
MISNRFTIYLIAFIGLISCKSGNYNDNRIKNFNLSECQVDCTDPDRMIREEYNDGRLKLTYGELMNCSMGDSTYLESININGDTLIIKLDKPHEIQHGDTVYAGMSCECYYIVDIELSDIEGKPKYLITEKSLDRDVAYKMQ